MDHTKLLRAISFALMAVIAGSAFGQGDSCSTAPLITAGTYYSPGITTGETAPGCGNPGTNGIWYRYIPVFTGRINVNSCHPENNSADNDTFVHIFTGSCDSLICVNYNDDGSTGFGQCYFLSTYRDVDVIAGETYYILWTNNWDDDAFFWNLTECGGIVNGEVYRDVNSNGTREITEGSVHRMLRIDPEGQFFYTNMDPFTFCSATGNYTISMPVPPLYHVPVPDTRSYSIGSVGDIVVGMDFALQSIPGIIDVGVDLWGWNPWIGNNTTLNIHYSNPGTEATQANVVLTLDPLISFVSASLAPSSTSGQDVNWDLGVLPSGASGSISVTIFTSIAATPNAPVLNYVAITTTGSDINPENNNDDLHGMATTSFDPNDKQVDLISLTPDDVLDRKPLEYTVRFQNTGTAPAVNVVIKDSLDVDWDLSTFEMIGASHPFTMTLTNEVMIWTFANILLPDSASDPEGSQGGFHYKMTPKNDLLLGDQLTNRADIYFDYNEPVLTNTTVTTVELASGVNEERSFNGLLAYPSPGNGMLNLRWMNGTVLRAKVTVLDAMGRAVATSALGTMNENQRQQLDLGELPNGSYIIRLQGDGVDARTRYVITR